MLRAFDCHGHLHSFFVQRCRVQGLGIVDFVVLFIRIVDSQLFVAVGSRDIVLLFGDQEIGKNLDDCLYLHVIVTVREKGKSSSRRRVGVVDVAENCDRLRKSLLLDKRVNSRGVLSIFNFKVIVHSAVLLDEVEQTASVWI